ncbi:MAG: CPBP family intramembrane metalloprotease [Actinomycetaceae bacterium]|nr:CPBP family intramembrane metalloprotease [Actinomycetaceae bacterium]
MYQNQSSPMRFAFPLGILVAVIGVGSLWISGQIFGPPSTTAAKTLLYYVIPLVTAVVMLVLLGQKKAFDHFGSKLPAVVTLGWYLIVAALTLAGLFYVSIPKDQVVTPALGTIGIYLAVTCTTALFEEILCRGTIQNLLVDRYGTSPAGVWKAIVLSSGIFALIHFANLIDKPYFVLGTLTQVVYTFCLATLIGVIYYLTKDLLVAIVLHAIFNFFGGITDVFIAPTTSAATPADIPLNGMIIQIAIMLPATLLAYRLYRKRLAAA